MSACMIQYEQMLMGRQRLSGPHGGRRRKWVQSVLKLSHIVIRCSVSRSKVCCEMDGNSKFRARRLLCNVKYYDDRRFREAGSTHL